MTEGDDNPAELFSQTPIAVRLAPGDTLIGCVDPSPIASRYALLTPLDCRIGRFPHPLPHVGCS